MLPRVKLPGRKYVRFAEADVEHFIDGARSGDEPRAQLRPRMAASSVRRF